MEVDLGVEIKNLKGEPIKEGDPPATVTLSEVCTNALLMGGEVLRITPSEKVQRSILAFKIQATIGRKPDLTVEDLALLKKSVEAVVSPLVLYRFLEIVDPTVLKKAGAENMEESSGKEPPA